LAMIDGHAEAPPKETPMLLECYRPSLALAQTPQGATDQLNGRQPFGARRARQV